MFKLKELAYSKEGLQPYISSETIEYHYNKHHKTYLDNLNSLCKQENICNETLETLIKTQSGNIFNNAAQVWNHTFYWESMAPDSGGNPIGQIANKIIKSFNSFENFKIEFKNKAMQHFGSGWIWIIQNSTTGKLEIETTSNAECPLKSGKRTILTCDLWEHAYYIDYRNLRTKYIDNWWNLVNWNFANSNLIHY